MTTARGTEARVAARPSFHMRLSLQLLLILFTFLALGAINGDQALSSSSKLDRLAWLTLVQLVLQISILASSFRSALAPPVVFSALLSLFTSGWVILRTAQLHYPTFDVLSRETSASIASATSFYLAAFSLYGLGVVVVGGGGHFPRQIRHEDELRRRLALSSVGTACIAVGAIPFLIININDFRVVFSLGYSAYYESGSRLTNPLFTLGYFFIVGLIFLAVSGGHSRAKKIAFVLGVVGILRMIAGDRGEGMIYLLSVVMMWRALGLGLGHRSGRGRLGPAVLAVFAVVFIPAVGSLRQSFGGGEFNLRQAFLGQNPIVETLRTMGGTLFPLVKVGELVPAGQDFLWGGSYLSGVLRLLPSTLIPAPLSGLVDHPLYASPATWLMERLGMSYGPGFTPFAEAYLNFGRWGGCLAMFVFGVVATLALRLRPGVGVFRMAFVLATFALCGFTVRGSSNFVVAPIVRYVLLPLGAALVLAPSLKRGRTQGVGAE